jgi:hypothetical protein
MKDRKCTKGFPKVFQPEMVLHKDGYPVYTQLNDGCTFKVGKHMVDNRWIVPYNSYLLFRYDTVYSFIESLTNQVVLKCNTHINMKCIMSLAATKYITRYTHKGSNCPFVEIQCCDEVSELKDCRYISPSEVSW